MSNITNLTADGSTAAARCVGTTYYIESSGTWGGGTITPQALSVDGVTWLTLGDTSLTADGAINVQVPSGKEIRATLAGATSPDLNIHISKIK